MKSYAVIGLGRFGWQIAEKLYELGQEVLVIDRSQERIDDIAEFVTKAVAADAKDFDVLKSLGVSMCDCAIVAVGSDLAASVLITMNLKNLGIKQVICKAYDETHCEILKKIGADQVIIPERIVADKLAGTLSSSNILDSIEVSSEYGIAEFRVPDSWIGKTIRNIDVRAKYDVFVIGIKQGGEITISPNADTVIERNSVLTLLGKYSSLDSMKKIK